MPTITRFEDLNCWKEARLLVNQIYFFSNTDKFARDFELKDQIRRAAISVMTNIAEGFSRFHSKESIRFFDFAQSSAAEVQSLIYLAEDLHYLTSTEAKEIREHSLYCQKMILSLIKHFRTNTR